MNFNALLEELLLELSGTEIYQKYYSKIPYETFVEIVMADPKSNIDGVGNLQSLGKYSKLLLSFYQKGTLQIEDLVKAKEYLGYVYQHRISLDINSLRSLADLYKVVQKYIIEDTLDFKEIINALTIDVDYKLLHEGEDWSFYQPLTEKGASYLGFGTEWCTTWGKHCLNKKHRDRDNYFQTHHNKGPLFIIMNKINPIDKYQFHFESNQYMDKMDRRINLSEFWFGKDEVKFYFFPSLVRETSKEEVESEVKRISILPDEDGMEIIKKSIGVINNPLVNAILTNDEDALEDLIVDDSRDGSVYINNGRLIIQVDKLSGDAEGVEKSIDQYRYEGSNGWEFVHSDIENKYYEQEDYVLDIEGIFTNYYNNNKSELSEDLGVISYEQFKDDYFDNYVNDENLKDYYVDDVTDLSYGSYQQENDKEADEIEKYLSFGSRSDELNFSVVFFVRFLIKKGISRIDYNSDNDNGLTLQDVTDMYISNYRLTVEIEEPVYNFEITYPKYGDGNYITKRTDEYFNKLIGDPENNKNCIELRKKLNNIINKFFNGGYGTNMFDNKHVRVQLKSQNIDCNTGSIKIDYENKDNEQNFYNKSVKIDNLVSYLTNYQLNLNESKLNLTSLISK
jgi:hypothetical protein